MVFNEICYENRDVRSHLDGILKSPGSVFGTIRESFWYDLGVISGSSGNTLAPSRDHVGMISGSFWHHQVVDLGQSGDHFGTTAVSFWNHWETILVPSGYHFGNIGGSF